MTRRLNLNIYILITACLVFCNSVCFADSTSKIKVNTFKDFHLTDLQNVKHTLSSYKGKWVIVNYWATWCPPCLEEVPDLVALYDSRKNKDVMVLGVVFDYESAEEVTQYIDDMLMSYPVILGDKSVVKQIGKPVVLPTTFIYNPKGLLVQVKRGLITKSYLEKVIAEVKIENK